jgi:hypothetical protein
MRYEKTLGNGLPPEVEVAKNPSVRFRRAQEALDQTLKQFVNRNLPSRQHPRLCRVAFRITPCLPDRLAFAFHCVAYFDCHRRVIHEPFFAQNKLNLRLRLCRAFVNGVAGGKLLKNVVGGRAFSPHTFTQVLRNVHHVRLEIRACEKVGIDRLARMVNRACIVVGEQVLQ